MNASAAHLYKSLAYTHESNYIDYERLKGEELEDVLYNSRYGGCRSPLIVLKPFIKEHENMMRILQTFVNTNKPRVHPTMEDIIIGLKSTKNKPDQPHSLDKQKSALDHSLDALRLSLCGMQLRNNICNYGFL
jgi:hypothetical protein